MAAERIETDEIAGVSSSGIIGSLDMQKGTGYIDTDEGKRYLFGFGGCKGASVGERQDVFNSLEPGMRVTFDKTGSLAENISIAAPETARILVESGKNAVGWLMEGGLENAEQKTGIIHVLDFDNGKGCVLSDGGERFIFTAYDVEDMMIGKLRQWDSVSFVIGEDSETAKMIRSISR